MRGTIRQRSRGSWELQVFLGRDAHERRKRHTETVRGRKPDAEKRMREIPAEVDKGMPPPEKTFTLAGLSAKFRKSIKAG